jgi:hypothetical protein
MMTYYKLKGINKRTSEGVIQHYVDRDTETLLGEQSRDKVNPEDGPYRNISVVD